MFQFSVTHKKLFINNVTCNSFVCFYFAFVLLLVTATFRLFTSTASFRCPLDRIKEYFHPLFLFKQMKGGKQKGNSSGKLEKGRRFDRPKNRKNLSSWFRTIRKYLHRK